MDDREYSLLKRRISELLYVDLDLCRGPHLRQHLTSLVARTCDGLGEFLERLEADEELRAGVEKLVADEAGNVPGFVRSMVGQGAGPDSDGRGPSRGGRPTERAGADAGEGVEHARGR
jgi:hypothetical protein